MRRLLCALVLLALPWPSSAASCDTNNLYTFAFQSTATATLNYANNYSFIATNGLGATQVIGISFSANGLSSSQVNGGAGLVQLPRIDTNVIASSTGAKTLTIGGIFSGRTANILSGTRTITTRLTFATPIRDLALVVSDIDFTTDQFRDWIQLSGSDGTNTFVPTMTNPNGNNNSGTPTATNSSIRFGPYTGITPNISSSEAIGIGASNNSGVTTGQINASFVQPVTSVTLNYGNFPLQTGEVNTGQQAMGISQISFCPVPVINVVKSSTPFVTTGPDRFNTPGSDVVYTMTATNNGGSTVDASTLVLTDNLPAGVTFYNGDFDPAAPNSGPIQLTTGSSGVTLASTSYSNGIAYGITPTTGYDPNVKALKITLGGSFAANSTAIIKFRVQIK